MFKFITFYVWILSISSYTKCKKQNWTNQWLILNGTYFHRKCINNSIQWNESCIFFDSEFKSSEKEIISNEINTDEKYSLQSLVVLFHWAASKLPNHFLELIHIASAYVMPFFMKNLSHYTFLYVQMKLKYYQFLLKLEKNAYYLI